MKRLLLDRRIDKLFELSQQLNTGLITCRLKLGHEHTSNSVGWVDPLQRKYVSVMVTTAMI